MIPRRIIFTFGMDRNFGNKPFSFVHYVAVRSAYEVNSPTEILFYYEYEPTGRWWEAAKPYVKTCPIEAPESIFGVPLQHAAHKTDVLRLKFLQELGGIYLDLDTICVQPFSPLLSSRFVMAHQAAYGPGLCSAVMLATAGTEFARRWLEGYDPTRSLWDGFRSHGDDVFWDELGVQYPGYLGHVSHKELTILPHESFFPYNWSREDIDEIFVNTNELSEYTYCLHLWETASWDYIQDLTPQRVRSEDTTYNLIARHYID